MPFVPLILSILGPGVVIPSALANVNALLSPGAERAAALTSVYASLAAAVVVCAAVYAGARAWYSPFHLVAAKLEGAGARFERGVSQLAGPVAALEFQTDAGPLRLQLAGLGLYAITRHPRTVFVPAGPGMEERVDAALKELGLARRA